MQMCVAPFGVRLLPYVTWLLRGAGRPFFPPGFAGFVGGFGGVFLEEAVTGGGDAAPAAAVERDAEDEF